MYNRFDPSSHSPLIALAQITSNGNRMALNKSPSVKSTTLLKTLSPTTRLSVSWFCVISIEAHNELEIGKGGEGGRKRKNHLFLKRNVRWGSICLKKQ